MAVTTAEGVTTGASVEVVVVEVMVEVGEEVVCGRTRTGGEVGATAGEEGAITTVEVVLVVVTLAVVAAAAIQAVEATMEEVEEEVATQPPTELWGTTPATKVASVMSLCFTLLPCSTYCGCSASKALY